MTYYFVTNERGDRVRDKDGIEWVEFDDIEPHRLHEYAYTTRQPAEGHVHHYDPEGRAGLQVVSREIEFNIR